MKKMKDSVIERMRARISPETKAYVRKSMELAVRIQDVLDEKRWSQKDLAKAMGKNESEISKWLSGSHNLTLKSITKLETVLGRELLAIISKHRFIVDHENNPGTKANNVEGFKKIGLTNKDDSQMEEHQCAV